MALAGQRHLWNSSTEPKRLYQRRIYVLAQVSNFFICCKGFLPFQKWLLFILEMNKFPPGQSESVEKGHLRTFKPFSPWDGYGGGTTHPVEVALMIKYELHIRMYYFQPQKYLPKNQGSRPTGQKENSHSPKSWRRPGHTPRAGHDGVLYHDVLPAGNHAATVLHAECLDRRDSVLASQCIHHRNLQLLI